MPSMETLIHFISRYCREYQIPFHEDSKGLIGDTIILPIRIGEILYSFQLEIKKSGEDEIFIVRVPVMEIPVGKSTLPLYRKLLEINDRVAGIHFSVAASTVYLSFTHIVGEKLYGGSLNYSGFKTVMNRIFATLTQHAGFLLMEFEDHQGYRS